ncbi:MAG: hypothetical protein ACYDG2_22020 [Ruminiclostridium sp.]
MPKIKVNILNKGDSVLFVNDRLIAVQRKNGEVDLIPMIFDNENKLPRIDTKNILTIAYGKNTVETFTNGDNGEIKVTTF